LTPREAIFVWEFREAVDELLKDAGVHHRAGDEEVAARTLDDECWLPVEPLLGFPLQRDDDGCPPRREQAVTEPEAPQFVEVDRAPDGIFATVSPFEDEGFRGELELADIGVAVPRSPVPC